MLHSWKFAANAVWEEALSIDATSSIDMDALGEWIAQSPQNIAFEAIFSDNGAPATMFGVRVTSLPKAEQIFRLINLLSKTDLIKTESDFQRIAKDCFPEFHLFEGELAALNIGIVGQWYSVKPEIIWDRQSGASLTIDELKAKAPRFFKPTRNPAAIEFWYNQPIDHWYKIYISDFESGYHQINPVKYLAAVSAVKNGQFIPE